MLPSLLDREAQVGEDPSMHLLNRIFDMLLNWPDMHFDGKVWCWQESGTAEPSGRNWEDAFTVDTDMGFLTAPVGASADEVYDFIEVCLQIPSC